MPSMPNLHERVASVIDRSYVCAAVLGWFAMGAFSGCTANSRSADKVQVIVTGCTALPRLQASRQDTLATREAISAYIDKWDALCGPPTEKKP